MTETAISSGAGPADASLTNDTSKVLRVVYVVGTYPSLTTTFIDREIAALRRLGASVQVVSIRRSRRALSPEQEALREHVVSLLPASIPSLCLGHARYAGPGG